MSRKQIVVLIASILVGLIFIISGIGKLLGHSAFLLSISSKGIFSEAFVDIIGTWLPWVELVLGVCLIAGVLIQLSALLSAVLAVALIFHNSWMIAHGLGYEPCNCFGIFDQLFQAGLSSRTALYIDIGLLALALMIYFLSPGRFFNLRPWYWRKGKEAAISS